METTSFSIFSSGRFGSADFAQPVATKTVNTKSNLVKELNLMGYTSEISSFNNRASPENPIQRTLQENLRYYIQDLRNDHRIIDHPGSFRKLILELSRWESQNVDGKFQPPEVSSFSREDTSIGHRLSGSFIFFLNGDPDCPNLGRFD